MDASATTPRSMVHGDLFAGVVGHILDGECEGRYRWYRWLTPEMAKRERRWGQQVIKLPEIPDAWLPASTVAAAVDPLLGPCDFLVASACGCRAEHRGSATIHHHCATHGRSR